MKRDKITVAVICGLILFAAPQSNAQPGSCDQIKQQVVDKLVAYRVEQNNSELKTVDLPSVKQIVLEAKENVSADCPDILKAQLQEISKDLEKPEKKNEPKLADPLLAPPLGAPVKEKNNNLEY